MRWEKGERRKEINERELTSSLLFSFRSASQGRASRIILVLLKDRETPLERWVFGFEDLLGLGVEEGGGGGRKGDEV